MPADLFVDLDSAPHSIGEHSHVLMILRRLDPLRRLRIHFRAFMIACMYTPGCGPARAPSLCTDAYGALCLECPQLLAISLGGSGVMGQALIPTGVMGWVPPWGSGSRRKSLFSHFASNHNL